MVAMMLESQSLCLSLKQNCLQLSTMDKKLAAADTKTKLTVHGFIHEIQNLFQNENSSFFLMPEGIINICILYYLIAESWSKGGEKIEISTKEFENDLAKFIMDDDGGWNTVYGSYIIDHTEDGENKKTDCKYRWKIKVAAPSTIIGIDASDYNWINSDLSIPDAEYPGYSCASWGAKYDPGQGQSFGGDYAWIGPEIDFLIVELNTKTKTLSYLPEDKDTGVKIVDVSMSNKYRFAISMCQEYTVQILEFEIVAITE